MKTSTLRLALGISTDIAALLLVAGIGPDVAAILELREAARNGIEIQWTGVEIEMTDGERRGYGNWIVGYGADGRTYFRRPYRPSPDSSSGIM